MKINRTKGQRAMALIGLLIVLFLTLSVLLVGSVVHTTVAGVGNSPSSSTTSENSGAMTLTTNTIQSSKTRVQEISAFMMAQAGVNVAINWLTNQPIPPINTAAFAPSLSGGAATGSPPREVVIPNSANPSSYFSIEMYPDVSNSTNTQKKYLIESIGTSSGVQQIIECYVSQSSLSKYEVLLNSWSPPNNYWVEGLSTFDGPVHDNNATGQAENVLWLTNPGTTLPLFQYTGTDAYTVSSAGVNWYANNYWTSQAPQSASDWASLAAGGAATVHTAAASVTFPSQSTLQLNAALGSATPPVNPGVKIPTTGSHTNAGIYVQGDVSTMKLSVGAPSSTQIITINQTDVNGNPLQSVITINASANTTTFAVTSINNGSPVTVTAIYTGTTNGVIYTNGNIGSNTTGGNGTQGTAVTGGLSGVVADNVVNASGQITHMNSLTIATNANDNLSFNGSITYNTARQKTANGAYVPENQDQNFTQNAGVLGVISNNILLDTTDANGNPITSFEFDGSEFAYNIVDADQWSSRATGTWENMGSYISNIVGVFGQFDSNNNLVTGFNTKFNYDQRLRNTPPPFYPTTGNQYDVVSWKRVTTTLQ